MKSATVTREKTGRRKKSSRSGKGREDWTGAPKDAEAICGMPARKVGPHSFSIPTAIPNEAW